MRVAVQPCGASDAVEHYVDTIQNLVSKDRIFAKLNLQERSEFTERCGDNVAVWGVTIGTGQGNLRKWVKLRPGDTAILYRNRTIFSVGRITYCVRNRDLALELWGQRDDGETWECIYFMDSLRELEVPITRYNEALNYQSNYIIQGFNVLEGEKAEKILDLLELKVDEAITGVSGALSLVEISRILSEIQSLSIPSAAKARAEAGSLRRFLFGKKHVDICDVCGRSLPVGFLVAAHIKPRSSCQDAEQRDPHVVMRTCKLGCDELFGRAYIVVGEDGTLSSSQSLSRAPSDLQDAAREILGRQCGAYRPENRHYFDWHRNHPLRLPY